MKSLLFTLFIALGLINTASAETRYVSDRLDIQMRTGRGTEFRIVRMLPSGTALTVTKVDKDSGYSQVRAPSGVEGWVLSRLLMHGPAARDRLANAEKRLAQLELENRTLSSSQSTLNTDKNRTEKARSKLEKENKTLSKDLEDIKRTASSALAIDSENRELKSKIVAYEREAQTLQQENQGLKDRTARDWFMVGAGVILLGIIIGLIIPRIRWRKKSSWDTL